MPTRLKAYWDGLPVSWREQLVSAWHTFVPAFVGSMLLSFQMLDGKWTRETLVATLLAVGAAAFRAGFKALSVWLSSKLLTK